VDVMLASMSSAMFVEWVAAYQLEAEALEEARLEADVGARRRRG